jgi:hypothetical protein
MSRAVLQELRGKFEHEGGCYRRRARPGEQYSLGGMARLTVPRQLQRILGGTAAQ